MINSFNGTPQYEVYAQALKLASFDQIKDTFIAYLEQSPDYTNEQKLAIKLAAEKLDKYPSSNHNINDGALLGIMNMAWEDIGAAGTSALSLEQREAILDGVLSVCKSIILAESDRLASVASLGIHLQYGYGYGEAGYGYGFEAVDFFDVFGV